MVVSVATHSIVWHPKGSFDLRIRYPAEENGIVISRRTDTDSPQPGDLT
jgi:hypothetical protein